MSRARVLWHLARADFLERVRRTSFLVTLGLAVYLGYVVSAGQLKLWLGDARGIYNSAWVGVLMALVANFLLSLAGFYVVKSAVERDRRTGVGEILATTPMSKPLYMLGKTASNFAVLVAMLAVLAAMGPVAQLMAGEETHVHLWPLLAPFLVLSLPAMAFVAACAVLFETLPLLRGGFGNVVWFFAWTGLMPAAIELPGFPDPFGLGAVSSQLFEVVRQRLGITGRSFTLGAIADERQARTFVWEGMDWTSAIVLKQLLWLLVAVGIALLAALFFDRFDPSRGRARARKSNGAAPEAAGESLAPPIPISIHLHPLPEGARRFRFFDLLRAETRLLLQGQRWWWWAVALGLSIAGFAAPLATARQFILPAAWIWPLLRWSALGSREARYGTEGLVFSAAYPLSRQLPAAWASGVLLAMITGGGVAVRLGLAADWGGLGAWTVGALFIPTLALALGVWSGGTKLFEVIYLLLWYLGPMQHVPGMDYLGVLPATVRAGTPVVYLVATALLGAAAVVGRRRRLQAA
ncbi:MAG TPA: hypothetical protein VII86_02170 [Thermoanaerobaculia bacterium]